jgi:hypothetical protein
MRTAIDHELVDPKVKINFEKMDFCIKNTIKRNTFILKGNAIKVSRGQSLGRPFEDPQSSVSTKLGSANSFRFFLRWAGLRASAGILPRPMQPRSMPGEREGSARQNTETIQP